MTWIAAAPFNRAAVDALCAELVAQRLDATLEGGRRSP
jgi:hypothetical protein